MLKTVTKACLSLSQELELLADPFVIMIGMMFLRMMITMTTIMIRIGQLGGDDDNENDDTSVSSWPWLGSDALDFDDDDDDDGNDDDDDDDGGDDDDEGDDNHNKIMMR